MKLSLVGATVVALGAGIALPLSGAASGQARTPHAGRVVVVAAVPSTNGLSDYGGYVLYSDGVLKAMDGAPFYGDARHSGLKDFAAIAEDDSSSGYWLVTATGKVFTFGTVCQGDNIQAPKVTGRVVGTMFLSNAQQQSDNVDTGFAMVTSTGAVDDYLCLNAF